MRTYPALTCAERTFPDRLPTEAEIKARVAAYAARPDVQACWADDDRLIAQTRAVLADRAA